MTMRDDRLPRRPVDIDEHNDAEEMDVQLSYREAALLVLPQLLTKAADVDRLALALRVLAG